MQSQIKGKVVAITGASGGIGKAIAIELAKQGARVVLGARRIDLLTDVASEIKNNGGEVIYAATDVTLKGHLVNLVQLAVKTFGRADVMINNAGVAQLSRIDELDIDGWEQMIDINVKGVLYGMAAAIPQFRIQGSGHIINIISTSGITISPEMGVYAGTKNAVRTIAEAFRQESDGRIRITGISPGFVKTDLADNIKNKKMKIAISAGMTTFALDPIAVANAVIYAITQPPEVEVGDIVIRPSAQR
jgi:NADP-dependent 3-hydroxy acid dehydrogenase YdfG